MLGELQQAMADVVACPDRARAAQADLAAFASGYALTAAERARLAGFVAAPSLALGCMVYRANRLAPLALNLGALCRALGAALQPAVEAFWRARPHADPNPLLECEAFLAQLDAPDTLRGQVAEARAMVGAALAAGRRADLTPAA